MSNPDIVGWVGAGTRVVVACARGLVAGLIWMGVCEEGGLGGERGWGGGAEVER